MENNFSTKYLREQIRSEDPDLIMDRIRENGKLFVYVDLKEERRRISETEEDFPQFNELWERYFSQLKILAYEEKARLSAEEWIHRWGKYEPSEWDQFHN